MIDDAIRVWRRDDPFAFVVNATRYARVWALKRFDILQRRLLGGDRIARYRTWKHTRGWDAAADPFEPIYVDPSEITHRTPHNPKLRYLYTSAVQDGDWDTETKRLFEWYDYYYETFRRRFLDGDDWEEIPYVQRCLSGDDSWRGRSGTGVYHRLATVDRLYDSLQNDGYRDQRELGSHDSAFEFPQIDNVSVTIARDGEILFFDGRHRLLLAQVLEIDEIPVRVCIRHRQWQELREEIDAADDWDELTAKAQDAIENDHPDLCDLDVRDTQKIRQ